jgi:pimeloyl-ACP methyl ester carboxylesterase
MHLCLVGGAVVWKTQPGFAVQAVVRRHRQLARIEVPTLLIAGSGTLPWLSAAAEQVAQAVPGARYLSLEGQDHGVLQQPAALLTCLREFLG